MLFTDSPYFTTVAELLSICPYLTDDLNPDINGNTVVSIPSAQVLAANDLATSINSIQISYSPGRIFSASNGISSNHLAGLGLFSTVNVATFNNTVRLRLSQIVITSEYANMLSPIQMVHAYMTLERIYEELARNINSPSDQDRFEARRDYYHDQVEDRYFPQLQNLGLPWVPMPMPCPGAVNEAGSGRWNASNVTLVSVAGSPGYASLYIAITYVDQTQPNYYQNAQNPNNCESDLSALINLESVPANESAKISIASLNPPNGQLALYGPTSAYYLTLHQATGWNIYAGLDPNDLYLQNPTPIPIATKTYTLPATLATTNLAASGQIKVYNLPITDMQVWRG